MVHVDVPVPPADGFVQLKAGPVVCDIEAKVVPAGTVSMSEMPEAAEGPAFATVIV
jgi:hypothetical protein